MTSPRATGGWRSSRRSSSGLKTKTLRLMPGEHDAAKDKGGAFREHFGDTHYAFDHKGVHFVTLDNVSDPEGAVGAAQIDWLAADLKKVRPRRAHRRVHAPPAVRPLPAVGLVDQGRRQGDRRAPAPQERDRLLRPHPPGAPPPDRAHRPPRRPLAGVPAAGRRVRSRRRCRSRGTPARRSRGSAIGRWSSARRRRPRRACASCRSSPRLRRRPDSLGYALLGRIPAGGQALFQRVELAHRAASSVKSKSAPFSAMRGGLRRLRQHDEPVLHAPAQQHLRRRASDAPRRRPRRPGDRAAGRA